MAHHIRVILTEDIPSLGKSGELVKVRPGFARNFLLPRGLALGATDTSVRKLEHDKKVAEARSAKTRSEAEALAQKLGAVKLTISCPVGEGNRLYGSVTSRDVEQALAAQGFAVDRRRIDLDPVKALGSYEVAIRLATNVTAKVALTVAAK